MSKYVYDYMRDAYPPRPLVLEPAPPGIANKESLTIAWILPPWGRGSGGHTTIFRLIRMMEEHGHRCSIFVLDPYEAVIGKTNEQLRREVNEWFLPIDAQVFNGLDSWLGADVAVATYWTTAVVMRDLPGCYEKVYLAQDFEPAFYAYSAEYIWAEDTYRMGYRGIAYTPWMADLLERGYGMRSEWFECGTDLDVYEMHEGDREPQTIAVYARASTARRAVSLSFLALAIVKQRRPEIKVVLYGDPEQGEVPFEYEDLGVTTPKELAALYRRSTIGLAFSLTTHSLVAQEMMASGLPVIELAGDNVAGALGDSGDVIIQAPPDPSAIADEIERLLDQPEQRAEMARRARKYVEERTWDIAGERVNTALRLFLATPREGNELGTPEMTKRVATGFIEDRGGPHSSSGA